MNEMISFLGNTSRQWESVMYPGYLGKTLDSKVRLWNEKYGEGNWRLAWETKDGALFSYDDVFWKIYVPGYVSYFLSAKDELTWLVKNVSYGFDKELITKDEAFDPYFLYNKSGHPNQFHNVAFNIAIEWYLGHPFEGNQPIQVRGGKKNTPINTWPRGWKWHPGNIPLVRRDCLPENGIQEWWWQKGSIEDFYQNAKVLQVKTQSP